MKIQIPKGLKLDVQPGQETELLAKVMVGKDGTLDFLSIDGIKLPTDEEEEKAEKGKEAQGGGEDGESPDVEALLSQIGGGSPDGGPEAGAPQPASPEEYFAQRDKARKSK